MRDHEYYCPDTVKNACAHKGACSSCDQPVATITCAYPGCRQTIRYPCPNIPGLYRPRYCRAHMQTMIARMSRNHPGSIEVNSKDPDLYVAIPYDADGKPHRPGDIPESERIKPILEEIQKDFEQSPSQTTGTGKTSMCEIDRVYEE